MRSRSLVFMGGALLGVTAGWLIGQRHLTRNRGDLFNPEAGKRESALGFLSGQVEIETVRLLRDYLSWESQPSLRRRAQSILRRIETALGTKAGG